MKVFITRAQTTESPFSRMLLSQGYQVEGASWVEVTGVPFEPSSLPVHDWLFFYSANGVKFFHQSLPFSDAKIGVVGKASAKAVEEHFGKIPSFIGEGTPIEIALAFGEVLGTEKVLFARAERSEQSVQKHLQEPKRIFDLIVYQNKLLIPTAPIEADVLVFTSPMNAEAYLQSLESSSSIPESTKIVAIGHTTAAALNSLGLPCHIISKRPDEESLAQAVIEFRV